MGRLLAELPRLEDGVYSEDGVADEVLRILGKPAGPLKLTIGTTGDV